MCFVLKRYTLVSFLCILCCFNINAKETDKKSTDQKMDISGFDKAKRGYEAGHYTVYVSQNISFQTPSVSKHKLPLNPSYSEQVWLSESGIRCELQPYLSGKAVMMECRAPENYKFQINADCEKNNSEKNAVSFFIGIEWKTGAHRNFKMWCGGS